VHVLASLLASKHKCTKHLQCQCAARSTRFFVIHVDALLCALRSWASTCTDKIRTSRFFVAHHMAVPSIDATFMSASGCHVSLRLPAKKIMIFLVLNCLFSFLADFPALYASFLASLSYLIKRASNLNHKASKYSP
jgi:hypothetical protein